MLKPDTFALTVLLGGLTALGPLSTDMYLPVLPALAADLGADVARAQLTLSAFLLGFIPGQLLYGPLADRLGRKPVVLAGLALFALASLACALAGNIETLIAARFAQALGASGPIVLARSMARDLYTGTRAAQELSRMGMILGFVPTVAPFFGGLIGAGAGWRGVFLAILACSLALATAVVAALPETLPPAERQRDPISARAILGDFRGIAADAAFRSYAAIVCMSYGGLFAFISGSSFVLQNLYGIGPVVFGAVFGLCALAYVAGTIVGQRIGPRRGIEATLRLGCLLLATGGALQLAAVLLGPGHAAEIVAPMLVFLVGVGVTLPQAMTGAMMPFRRRAGAASSLSGVIQMTGGAAIGVAVGVTLEDSALPLAVAMATTGTAALLLFHSGAGSRRAALATEAANA